MSPAQPHQAAPQRPTRSRDNAFLRPRDDDASQRRTSLRRGGGCAIPDDIENRSLPKASGRVTLPRHLAWSFPYCYDLDNRRQLRAAYERVMTEGLEDDVRFYIDLATLLELWDELWLLPHVREAWSTWLSDRGLIA